MVGVRGNPDAGWHWNIYLHLPYIFLRQMNIGRYSIHGAYGKCDRENDVRAEWKNVVLLIYFLVILSYDTYFRCICALLKHMLKQSIAQSHLSTTAGCDHIHLYKSEIGPSKHGWVCLTVLGRVVFVISSPPAAT